MTRNSRSMYIHGNITNCFLKHLGTKDTIDLMINPFYTLCFSHY